MLLNFLFITVNVWNLNMFGFQTVPFCSVPNYFEQTKVSEIQTDCLDFRHKFVSEIWTHIAQTEQNVWISDTYNQRPKSEQFGFRTEIFHPVLNTVRFQLCLKSEQICSVFRRYITERSDFGQLTKLGRFIYKDRYKKNSYLYKTV